VTGLPRSTLKHELKLDGLHPDEAGYRAWAKTIRPTLEALMEFDRLESKTR